MSKHNRDRRNRDTVADKKEIPLTKTLQVLFDRYGVKLRNGQQVVTHATYGTRTAVSPIVFAVFEAAIKSDYFMWVKASDKTRSAFNNDELTPDQFLKKIADYHKISLVDSGVTSVQAGEDKRYLSGLIAKAGYYSELID